MTATPDSPSITEPMTDSGEPGREDRTRRAGIALIVLVALAILLAWWLWSQTALVPDVRGMTEQQARIALQAAGFEVGEVEFDQTAFSDPGTIDDQGVAPGTRAIKGDEIDLMVAKAPEESDDVEVSGDLGLESDGSASDDDETDSIRDRGDDEYNTGIGKVTYPGVPQVLNQTESSASSELRAAGFSVRVIRAPNAGGIATGRVFFQTPEPAAPYSSGVVEIWVSTGAPTSGVPYKRPNIPADKL